MYVHRSKPSNSSGYMSLTDASPGSPTDGLLSKAKRKILRSSNRSIYGGTSTILSLTDDEVDSDDESGLCSSGGSNFTVS